MLRDDYITRIPQAGRLFPWGVAWHCGWGILRSPESFYQGAFAYPNTKTAGQGLVALYMWNLKTKVMEESIRSSSKLTWLDGKSHHLLLNINIFKFHSHVGFRGCISCNTLELSVFSQLVAKVFFFSTHFVEFTSKQKRGQEMKFILSSIFTIFGRRKKYQLPSKLT